MDLTTQTYYEPPPPQSFSSQEDVVPTTQGMMMKNSGCYRTNKGGGGGHPIAEALLCELNLKETCDFVKAFPPMTNNNNNNNSNYINGGGGAFLKVSAEKIRRQGADSVTSSISSVEAPPTPGRPIFSFSNINTVGNYNFPSKWDDAQKWLINCADSPPPPPPPQHPPMLSRQYSYRNNNKKSQLQTPPQLCKSTHESPISLDHRDSVKAFDGDHVLLLKDKLTTDEEEPKFRCLEPMKLFGDSADPVDIIVKHRDTGTEMMTPLGMSTTSRCHTPFKSSSPARHNTPATAENRSGPLALTTSIIDIAQFEESCHRAKLQLGDTHYYDSSITSNWSSWEEEEEEISKSLRHFEMGTDFRKSTVSDLKAFQWEKEEEENTKCCLRYQREEAKIQAWVNLENAKAEAQSRKLEVKIQRLRSNLEEKLMKRMGIVHRKAEELRAAVKLQHGQQTQKPIGQGRKMMHTQNPHSSCGCVQTIIHKTRK